MTNTKAVTITIPEGVRFSDLKLSRDAGTGDISFDWAPIEAICEASGIDIAVFRDQHEDNVAGFIMRWYMAHLDGGGAPDPVQETIMAEVRAEDELGHERVGRGSGSLQ